MPLINFKDFKMSRAAMARIQKDIKRKQKIMAQESLKRCEPLIPKQTGKLIRSGVATANGIEYRAPYAEEQYMSKESRPYDANRGGHWFERMKVSNKVSILKKVREG